MRLTSLGRIHITVLPDSHTLAYQQLERLRSQGAHDSIAGQLLKDERIFAAMQGMLAKMVYQAFAQREHPAAWQEDDRSI